MFKDYLSPTPIYTAAKFRKIFHIPLKLYWKLQDELLDEDPSFKKQKNAARRSGHSSHQKLLCCNRRLRTGLSFVQLDYMLRMNAENQRVYFQKFLIAAVCRFAPVFLNREPNLQELRRIVGDYEKVGFPVCIACIDCTHMHWKNCPMSLKGQYHNPKDGKLATVSCEALVEKTLYCWHWFPGR